MDRAGLEPTTSCLLAFPSTLFIQVMKTQDYMLVKQASFTIVFITLTEKGCCKASDLPVDLSARLLLYSIDEFKKLKKMIYML